MAELHETRMGRSIESNISRIADSLEAIAAGGKDEARFSPRELLLLLEAVEFYVIDVKTENDAEFRSLEGRLAILTGKHPNTR